MDRLQKLKDEIKEANGLEPEDEVDSLIEMGGRLPCGLKVTYKLFSGTGSVRAKYDKAFVSVSGISKLDDDEEFNVRVNFDSVTKKNVEAVIKIIDYWLDEFNVEGVENPFVQGDIKTKVVEKESLEKHNQEGKVEVYEKIFDDHSEINLKK